MICEGRNGSTRPDVRPGPKGKYELLRAEPSDLEENLQSGSTTKAPRPAESATSIDTIAAVHAWTARSAPAHVLVREACGGEGQPEPGLAPRTAPLKQKKLEWAIRRKGSGRTADPSLLHPSNGKSGRRRGPRLRSGGHSQDAFRGHPAQLPVFRARTSPASPRELPHSSKRSLNGPSGALTFSPTLANCGQMWATYPTRFFARCAPSE